MNAVKHVSGRTLGWSESLQLIDVHCAGEIGRVLAPGALELPGATMLERMEHINRVDDSLRRFLVFEPRGSVHMSVNVICEPCTAGADAGFIVLQADRAHPMSGSNCICVVTALLESGLVPMTEPSTTLRLDTPVGLVTATATCRDERCVSVTLENVASFVERLDAPLRTPQWGLVNVDVAFGGVYYVLVDVEQVGLAIRPRQARQLVEAGMSLRALANEQIKVRHPQLPGIDHIAYVMFRSRERDGAVRTCTTLAPGRVDRSPCGTGSSANLATLHARGQVKAGEVVTSRSIIGGEFEVELAGQTQIAGRAAVMPRITGKAWIYGLQEIRRDAADPFPTGFVLSDTWGPDV